MISDTELWKQSLLPFKQEKCLSSNAMAQLWMALHENKIYKISRGLAFWHVYVDEEWHGKFSDELECVEYVNELVRPRLSTYKTKV